MHPARNTSVVAFFWAQLVPFPSWGTNFSQGLWKEVWGLEDAGRTRFTSAPAPPFPLCPPVPEVLEASGLGCWSEILSEIPWLKWQHFKQDK